MAHVINFIELVGNLNITVMANGYPKKDDLITLEGKPYVVHKVSPDNDKDVTVIVKPKKYI